MGWIKNEFVCSDVRCNRVWPVSLVLSLRYWLSFCLLAFLKCVSTYRSYVSSRHLTSLSASQLLTKGQRIWKNYLTLLSSLFTRSCSAPSGISLCMHALVPTWYFSLYAGSDSISAAHLFLCTFRQYPWGTLLCMNALPPPPQHTYLFACTLHCNSLKSQHISLHARFTVALSTYLFACTLHCRSLKISLFACTLHCRSLDTP